MRKSKNNIFLFFGLLLIIGSGIQMVWPVFPIVPLNGSFSQSNKPSLSSKNWFKETYQQETESWLKENFGFRNFYVRLYHQISFRLYKKAYSSGVIVGKKNYLFEKFYIDALYGHDFTGIMKWEEKIGKLSALSDSLHKINKSILICIAPSKAAYYEEYIPGYLKSDKKPFNYLYMNQRLKEEGIPVIDFYSWFNTKKTKTPYPLFPKTGIHWSEYGQYLAGDSLFRYFNKLGYKMPELHLDSLEVTRIGNKQDTDIERAMNLLFPISLDDLAYPRYHVTRKDTLKPRGTVVGDSFYWQFMADGMHKDFFNNGEFWYYNRDIIVAGGGKIEQSIDYLKSRVEKTDLFLIICSEGGLSKFAWGFIDDLYSLYFDSDIYAPSLLDYIDRTKNTIYKDSAWLAKTRKKAIEKSISLDSMMILDALYLYEKKQRKTICFEPSK